MKKKITSETLKNLLLRKHSKDICIPECKTGSTWSGRTFQQLDMWVMKPSWTQVKYWGYEIKVSRSDFLRDDKWRGYLPFCTDFSFVAPPGIISPDELPEEVGLLLSSKNGTRLYTKKKSPTRDVQIPDSILRYIIMWRSEKNGGSSKRNKKYWESWLKDKEYNKDLGYQVSQKIRERVIKVQIENEHLQREIDALKEVRETINQLGFNKDCRFEWSFVKRINSKLKEIESGVPHNLPLYIKRTINDLQNVHDVLTQ